MNSRTKSISWLMISNVFFGLLPVLVKIANGLNYSGVEETFFRFVFAFLGVLFLWMMGWQSFSLVNVKALFWRGFFGALAILGYFIALQTTSSGKGTLLNYTYILWTNVFSVLFFKQKAPKGFFWYLLLAAVGIELVLDVHWDSFNFGDLIGLLSGIAGGAAILGVKECRQTDTALSVFASFTLFSLVLSGGLLLWGEFLGPSLGHSSAWVTPDAYGLFILLAVGAVAMIAQMLFTEVIGYTSLGLGTFLTLSVPVLATLFGLVFLQEPLTPHFLTGMLLVLAACGAMIWQDKQNLN
jgi:drug/metabolite transporter (DMT)-like permease